MSLSIKSRNADKAREASQWVKPEQAKLEAAWLTQHYFQPFTAPDGAPAIKQDHVRIALESRDELAPLMEQLKQEGATETEARQKTVAHMLDFIQAIPINCSTASRAALARVSEPAPGAGAEPGDCDSR